MIRFFKKISNLWTSNYSLTLLLIILVFYLFVLIPQIRDGDKDKIFTGIFFSVLLVTGVASVVNERKYKILILVFASLTFLTRWVASVVHSDARLFSDISSIIYFIILAFIITKHIFNNKKIDIHKIMGAVVLYLLIGLIFAYIYSILDFFNPESFIVSVAEPFENYEAKSFYYSFITLTTTGFGDVIPATAMARNFTVMESLIGQLFPVILIARLVSIEIAHKAEKK
jgi:hypothetical protein